MSNLQNAQLVTAHRTITVKELEPLVTELAKAYAKDKGYEADTAKAELKDKLTAAEPKLHGATVSFWLLIKKLPTQIHFKEKPEN